MKLEDALKVSETEHALDRGLDTPRVIAKAKRIYYQTHGRVDKYIVSYTKHNFEIVWADSMRPIGYGTFVHLKDYDEVFRYDDWEPI